MLIVAAVGRWLRLTDPDTGARVGGLLGGHTDAITALTITEDDQPIAIPRTIVTPNHL